MKAFSRYVCFSSTIFPLHDVDNEVKDLLPKCKYVFALWFIMVYDYGILLGVLLGIFENWKVLHNNVYQ